MAGELLKIIVRHEGLLAALKNKGPRVVSVLRTKLDGLLFQLQAYVVGQKLSGQVLHRRTGILSSSVRVIPASFQGTKIVGAIEAGGSAAMYARVHEYGGTSAYEIIATKARALRFISHGKTIYAHGIMHPPARQRAFMRPALDENKEMIKSELQDALNKVIAE